MRTEGGARVSDEIYLTEFYIMPVEGLATLRKEMTGLVDEDVAGGVLFRYGYRSGYEIMRKLNLEVSMDNLSEIFEEIWHEIGLGRARLLEDDGKISVVFEESLEAKANGKKTAPSCDFTRGYLAGIISRTLGKKYYATEEKCISMGNDVCLFRLSSVN